jgi:hypothetical protein
MRKKRPPNLQNVFVMKPLQGTRLATGPIIEPPNTDKIGIE